VIDSLEADHDILLESDVFTSDLIETWIDLKRENEIAPIQLRPHPHKFEPEPYAVVQRVAAWLQRVVCPVSASPYPPTARSGAYSGRQARINTPPTAHDGGAGDDRTATPGAPTPQIGAQCPWPGRISVRKESTSRSTRQDVVVHGVTLTWPNGIAERRSLP
jgi:hypothetical protein